METGSRGKALGERGATTGGAKSKKRGEGSREKKTGGGSEKVSRGERGMEKSRGGKGMEKRGGTPERSSSLS